MCCTTRVAKAVRTFLVAASLLGVGSALYAVPFIPDEGDDVFELDGNLTDDAHAGIDWETADGAPNVYYYHKISDNGEGQGAQDDNTVFAMKVFDEEPISGWDWKAPNNGKTTDKDNLINGTVVLYDFNGDLILYLQADRFDNNGNAYMGAWLFKGDVHPDTSDPDGGGFIGEHQDGDLLVMANFEKGGDRVNILMYEWSGGPDSGVVVPVTAEPGHAFSNSGGESAIYPYNNYLAKKKSVPVGTYPEYTLFEGRINLSYYYRDVKHEDIPCFSSALIETRSSASLSAELKDFIMFEDFETCGLSVTKECNNSVINASGTAYNNTYDFNVTNTGFGTITLVEVNDTIDGHSYMLPSISNLVGSHTFQHTFNDVLTMHNSVQVTSDGYDTVGDTADCEPPLIERNVTVTKHCKQQLEGVDTTDGNFTVVRVDFQGQVCNTGDSKIIVTKLEDLRGASYSKTITNFTPANGELTPGQCLDYSGSYYPPEPGNTCANHINNERGDHVRATYTEVLTNTTGLEAMSDEAVCPLCEAGCPWHPPVLLQ